MGKNTHITRLEFAQEIIPFHLTLERKKPDFFPSSSLLSMGEPAHFE